MEIQLHELIAQIKKDGVDAAENQATTIVNDAKAQAEKILADAQAQAEKILLNAKTENEKMVRSGEDAIRQAGRNLLISFRESIAKELYSHMHQNKDAIIQSIVTGENEDGEKLGKDDEPGISTIRLFYVSLFKSVLEAQKKELADQERQELELLKLSSEQRRKIAAKAKVWRVEKIEPLRQKLDDILEEVNDIWS